VRKLIACFIFVIAFTLAAFGISYKVLWNFGGSPSDGATPLAV